MRMSLLVVLFALSGCLGNVEGRPIPQDKLYFPSILLQNNNTLYVVNTNLDLQYKTGSISQIDIAGQKINQVTLIPSLPGQVIANPDFSTIITTSQQSNSILSVFSNTSLSLQYNAPYFLTFYADNKSGLLGYLSPATNEFWDPNRFSVLADQSELQSFTYDPVAGIQITHSYQLATCFPPPAKSFRRIARIGGISFKNGSIYILAEFFIDDPAGNNKFTKRVFLIRTVPGDTFCNDQTLKIDITKSENAQAARGLVITNDGTKAYALLDENPDLLAIDLTAQSVVQRTPTCKSPATLKLSPDETTLLVACPKSNELVGYNASNLSLFGMVIAEKKDGVPLTGGPLDVLFDQTNSKQIFVSYQQDHKVGIFKYENSSASNRSLSFSKWIELSR